MKIKMIKVLGVCLIVVYYKTALQLEIWIVKLENFSEEEQGL